MKNIYKYAIAFIALIALIFFFGNYALSKTEKTDTNNFYKVEINRILNNGVENFTAADYKCIKSVELLPLNATEEAVANFYRNSNDEYTIIHHNGELFRFNYVSEAGSNTSKYIVFNVALSVMTIFAIALVVLIYYKVLLPFRRITKLPYELSKGNLTEDIPESKNRLFGKFIWGLNLLRDNLNDHKKNELALMKQQKTMILSISHDIKTPLSAIKLYVKAISRNLYSDEAERNEALEKINMHADSINSSINEIIKTSSEDFMDFDVSDGEFYFDSLVDRIKSFYGERLEFARIGFTVGDFDNCLISGDFDRCVEVIENLMENAIKYGDGKKIEICFSKEDDYRLMTVKNTGCTISETELLHIFDSFWRGSNSVGVSGSGLGLFICRNLMRKMGGDIFAEVNGDEFCATAVFKTV